MPTIQINLFDGLTPTQKALLEGIRGPGMITAASRAMAGFLRNWFAGLEETRPNKQGFPRQHFWADVRRSVQNPVVADPTFASVSITHRALRQRIEGGVIRPGAGKKYLTIPATEAAYGHVAREFNNLHFGFAENKYGNLAPALIENTYQKIAFGRKRKDGTRKATPGEERGGKVFYFLARQVYQAPDPTVLPPNEQVQSAAVTGAIEFAQAQADRAQRGGKP